MPLKAVLRRSSIVGWDVAMWTLATLFLTVVRYDLTLSQHQIDSIFYYALVAAALQIVLGFVFQVYLGRNKVGSFAEVVQLGALVFVVAFIVWFGALMFESHLPHGVASVVPALALLGMVSGRMGVRMLRAVESRRSFAVLEAPWALVYGAGDAGEQVARLVDTAVHPPYSLVGFVDDDPEKRFLRIRGYRVWGRGEDLIEVAKDKGAEVVIFAISDASRELMDSVATRCKEAGLKLVVIPPVREMIDGQVDLSKLRAFNVEDLLGRRPIETDLSAISEYLNGKVVLVTGAGGSIGSELSRQLKRMGPSKLLLLDRDESALHSVQLSIYGQGLLDTDDMVLCDIRDEEALRKIFLRHRPQVVFHAAALKHLPMLEQYPEEGWKTNVLGSLNVLTVAREVGVERFVNISTDKAADATSVLGQTKRLAERLTAQFAEETGMPYLSVRFGNVLGSRGSVLYTFRAQIERGGPLTVTHPDVTRFFMTIPEACELVLQAGAIGQPADVLVLDMGEPVKIVDVAKRLIEESGRTDIRIEYTGLRPGEKMHEVLFSQGEDYDKSRHPLISRVSVPPLAPEDVAVTREEADISELVRTG